MSSNPIPVIICGKILAHHKSIAVEALAPEYKVLDVYGSVPRLATALKSLLSPPEAPALIFMGGCFDRAEFDEAYALEETRNLAWVRPEYTKPGEQEALAAAKTMGTPNPDILAGKVKGMIDEYFRYRQGREHVEEGVWYG